MIDLLELQTELAKFKVYNAWQYVNSLREHLTYMQVSKQLIEKVYGERKNQLMLKEQELFEKVKDVGSVKITQSDLQCTNIKIASLNIDDGMFIKKTMAEFFHYARISFDILFQIINAALLGDEATSADHKKLISYVNQKLKVTPNFKKLFKLLEANRKDEIFQYLQAFDNYTKHIETILISVSNSFLLGDNDIFVINEFSNGKRFAQKDAIAEINLIAEYINNVIDKILIEIKKQLPNHLDVSSRIQDLQFKVVIKENKDSNADQYVSFFIEVQNDLTDLKSEIKVYPMIIKPNGDVYDFEFSFPKIFIKKVGGGEETIIGIAELKENQLTNEIYRTYIVRSCDFVEYIVYMDKFVENYPQVPLNYAAMTGTIVSIG